MDRRSGHRCAGSALRRSAGDLHAATVPRSVRSARMRSSWRLGGAVAALVVLAACTSDSGTRTAQSSGPGPTASMARPASATVSVRGDTALTSAFAPPDVRCRFPDVDGPSIALLSTPTGLVFRIKVQQGKVTVLVTDDATPTPHERDFSGTGVTSFDPATGAQVDSALTEIPATAGTPGDIGQLSAIKASIDCAGQDPGTSTVTLAGDTPQGPLADQPLETPEWNATHPGTRCPSSASSPSTAPSNSSSSDCAPTA